jgi:hypothetical protein
MLRAMGAGCGYEALVIALVLVLAHIPARRGLRARPLPQPQNELPELANSQGGCIGRAVE